MLIADRLPELAGQLVPINVGQYETLMRCGVIAEGAPIELLDGMLVRKDRAKLGNDIMTIGNDHIYSVEAVSFLNQLLQGSDRYVRSQQPIQIGEYHEPEPDGVIVRGVFGTYRTRKPRPADILSVIEVSDSSTQLDRTTKQTIYASGDIPQYVIVNLVDLVVEVYSRPVHESQPEKHYYGDVNRVDAGGVVRFNLGEGRTLDVPVKDLLP